jgi:hypothetical protein
MAINVDFYDKIVYITSPTTDVTVQELIDAIREAEDTPEGMAFGGEVAGLVDAIADATGKDEIGTGISTGITMTLKSDWYIEFWDGVNLGTVSTGNIAGGLGDRPVRATVSSADTALVLGAVATTSSTLDMPVGDVDTVGSFGKALVDNLKLKRVIP